MKYIILVPDGMADEPLPELGGKTPVEAASTPNLDQLATHGLLGLFCPIPEGMPPGSDIGNLTMFGYNPREAFRGRAPIEAATRGISLAPDEVAFRCNLVTVTDGRMEDFTSGHITTEESHAIMATLDSVFKHRYPVRFYGGVSYRNLAVMKANGRCTVESLVSVRCTPPHDIPSREVSEFLPAGGAADVVRALMDEAAPILHDHPVVRARREAGLRAPTMIWLWGQGTAPNLEPYSRKFGLTGAVISAVDLVNGMGIYAGLDIITVEGATGWIDTNYQGKCEAGLSALDTHDFVFIHLEAPDEAAHQGRADYKVYAMEQFDRYIVGPCVKWVREHQPARILIAPDHQTLVSTRTHAGGAVPFVAYGAGVKSNNVTGAHRSYTEREADGTDIRIGDGYRLVEGFLRGETLPDAALVAGALRSVM